MTVYFHPYSLQNPYQLLLATHLRKKGAAVGTEFDLKRASNSQSSNRDEIIHIHWLRRAELEPRVLLRWFAFYWRLKRIRKKSYALVWTAHNLIPHESKVRPLDLWLTKKIVHLADRVICHSPTARAEVIECTKLAETEKVSVIPHGSYIGVYPNTVSPALSREQLGINANDVVFLFLGLIKSYKGVPELISAFRKLKRTNAKLVIAGKPADEVMKADLETQIGHDPSIIFHPKFVPDEEIQTYMNAANVVVFPYRRSLTSGALILAMSYGRACIAPRLGGITDCLPEGGGLLYDAENPDGLRLALEQAIAGTEKLPAMGAENMRRAEAWNWNFVAEETRRCYGEALERRRSKP